MGPPLYAVLLKGHEHLKPVEIARVMAAIQKVPFQDMLNPA